MPMYLEHLSIDFTRMFVGRESTLLPPVIVCQSIIQNFRFVWYVSRPTSSQCPHKTLQVCIIPRNGIKYYRNYHRGVLVFIYSTIYFVFVVIVDRMCCNYLFIQRFLSSQQARARFCVGLSRAWNIALHCCGYVFISYPIYDPVQVQLRHNGHVRSTTVFGIGTHDCDSHKHVSWIACSNAIHDIPYRILGGYCDAECRYCGAALHLVRDRNTRFYVFSIHSHKVKRHYCCGCNYVIGSFR